MSSNQFEPILDLCEMDLGQVHIAAGGSDERTLYLGPQRVILSYHQYADLVEAMARFEEGL